MVAGRAGANLRMAYGAGDPLSLQLVTAIRQSGVKFSGEHANECRAGDCEPWSVLKISGLP